MRLACNSRAGETQPPGGGGSLCSYSAGCGRGNCRPKRILFGKGGTLQCFSGRERSNRKCPFKPCYLQDSLPPFVSTKDGAKNDRKAISTESEHCAGLKINHITRRSVRPPPLPVLFPPRSRCGFVRGVPPRLQFRPSPKSPPREGTFGVQPARLREGQHGI